MSIWLGRKAGETVMLNYGKSCYNDYHYYMNRSAITVVTGPLGVGKTTWIRQHLAGMRAPVLYFNPGAGTVPIDQTYIAIEFPAVQILTEGEESQLLEEIPEQAVVYIELGFHLNLAAIEPVLAELKYYRGDDVYKLLPQELAKRLSLVLTDRVDVGMLSAYVVTLGRYPYTDWWGQLTPRDQAITSWAIQAVGTAHLSSRNVSSLSDGERQKVMIARALAQSPVAMLLDEPTAFLDLPRRTAMLCAYITHCMN
jgi:ABC-type cobalamin/Fe3+-siderophores transport system ATPase subunit